MEQSLQNVPIFQGCTRRQLLTIARISKVIEVPAGTTLAHVGEPGDEFFIILRGRARVEVPPGRRMRLAPGDFFGEMSLLDGEPRSATVAAETGLRLLVIHRDAFGILLRRVPYLTYKLLLTLLQRVRQAEKSLLA